MTSGRLFRSELDSLLAAGVLYRASMTVSTQVAGRLYRAELDSATFVAGRLYRAQIDQVTIINGRLYRAELDSTSQPVQVHTDQTGPVEPGDTVTLFGTGGNSPFTTRGWTQTDGPTVTLTGASTATATFVAPATLGDTTLSFSYIVDGASAQVDLNLLGVSERRLRSGALHPLLPQTA